MTGQAAQAAAACAITFAQTHREVVFEQIRTGGSSAYKRNSENSQGLIQRSAGTKVGVVFPGLEYSGVPALMAIHADVFRQAGGEPAGIDDTAVGR